MNRYKKYCPNVFLAQCPEPHEKGEIIEIETKRGNVNEHYVHNLILQKDGYYYYSITRVDGYDARERAKRKAERHQNAAINSEKRSSEYYKKAGKDSEFLKLGEPIKVGHHSEKRHRKAYDDLARNMNKSVEHERKAEKQESKADYWDSKTEDINLSMPESIEYFADKLEKAKEHHAKLKSGEVQRRHSYDLTYAKKQVNDMQDKYNTALKLWGN